MMRELSNGSRSIAGRSAARSALAAAACMLLAGTATAHDSFADVVERVTPAVVNISVVLPTQTVASNDFNLEFDMPPNVPFREMFEEFLKSLPNPQDNQGRNYGDSYKRSVGSGFIISEDGYIVTNNHVVQGSSMVYVEMVDGTGAEAQIIGTDEKTDIALIKIEHDGPLPFVEFGNSGEARVGDVVLAIGNPHGLGFSVSSGIISARNRVISGSYDDFIQTDAAINVGNSGGPLFNHDGEVIGVNTLIMSNSRRGTANPGSLGIGFAMASIVVEDVVNQLREYGTTRRGWLGVLLQPVDPDMAEALGREEATGALVSELLDGPAKDAGIEAGDLIVSFDGNDVMDVRSLIKMVGKAPVGETVGLGVFRNGEVDTIFVTLGRREEAEAALRPASVPDVEPDAGAYLGMEVGKLTPEIRAERGIDEAVEGLIVLGVDEASTAWKKGLRENDVVVSLGNKEILSSPSELAEGISKAQQSGRKFVQLLVRSDQRFWFIALPVVE